MTPESCENIYYTNGVFGMVGIVCNGGTVRGNTIKDDEGIMEGRRWWVLVLLS